MSKKIDTQAMLTLQKGVKLICVAQTSYPNEIKGGKVYVFEGYDETNIPKNKQNAVMTWYSDGPIWTPEKYEEIRYEFMLVKLEGIEKPQRLKDFDII